MNTLMQRELKTNKLQYKFLDWDTDYFGINSSRLTLKEVIGQEEWNTVYKLLNSNEFNVIININNDSINNFFIAQLGEAFVTDINFQFIKEISKKIECNNKFYISIQNKFPENTEVLDISKNSYKHSRFFNDPFLNKEKAEAVYCHWVESSFNRDDKYFVTACIDSKLVGYILFSIDDNKKTVAIELISVLPGMEHRSIGSEMVNHLEQYLYININNIKYLQVGTQSNNINAINFYVGNGFRVKELRTVYHYWPDKNMKFESIDEVAACLNC